MSSTKEFRVLLFEISEELHQRELRGIIYTEGLPQRFENEPALTILMKLEMLGKISEKKHKDLEEILKTVHRNDLQKKVEKFSKQKRRKQQNTQRDKELHLTANLEVGLVQTRLLKEHLQNTAASAPSNMKVTMAAAKGHVEQLEKALLEAKAQDQPDSSESDTSPQNTLKKTLNMELEEKLQPKLPKEYVHQPHPSTKQETTIDDIYEEVFVHLQPHCLNYEHERARLENQNDDSGGSTLVTGILKNKPKPPPKPSKLIKNPNKFTGPVVDDEDEGNYTGGTTGWSGSGTGSGFVDPTPYLKVNIKKPPQLPSIEDAPPTHMDTAYYKTICKEEVGGPLYYKMANRERDTQKFHELMEPKDEGIYELPSTHQH